MLNFLTKLAILTSFVVFAGFTVDDWLGQLTGRHDEIKNLLDLPQNTSPLPTLPVLLGTGIAFAGIAGLTISFIAIWRILSDGPTQDFRHLARRLHRMAYGFLTFWLSNYLLFSLVRSLILWQTPAFNTAELHWDPFGPDLIFAITAVALLAIAKMMERAWQAEDETRHFL
ncbi:MAG: hypothetical protein CR993_08310 [Rhodobacterales bacterium]|nr:MAG: hypothetical protein CR993_08310 [Rhodobacterales bacterium]